MSKFDTADSRQTLFGNIEMLMNEIHAHLKTINFYQYIDWSQLDTYSTFNSIYFADQLVVLSRIWIVQIYKTSLKSLPEDQIKQFRLVQQGDTGENNTKITLILWALGHMGWVEQIFGRMCAAMSTKEQNISKPVAASLTFVILRCA